MRIGLVCPYHLARPGGVLDHVKRLHYELTKRGHYVKIITPLPRDFEEEVPPEFITLGTSMNTTAFAGTAWQMSFSVDNSAIDEVFEREKFDVLHFHEPWIPMWGRQLLARAQTATIGTMHGRFYDTMTAKTVMPFVNTYIKPIVKYIDVFTAVSEAPIEYFETISHRPVIIVPNGIDLAKFKNYKTTAKAKKSDMKTIFYVGRLENRKGVKYLLRAFNELAARRDDVRLVIAGTGVDDKKLKHLVEDEKIPRVEFLGYVSEEDKIRWLHEADLFCSPAIYGESFGIVLLEAMASSLPIVAGDNIGYSSTMKETGAISLVNPKDTVDFARRLELMTFDERLRAVWREWADEYVRQFDFPEIVDQYVSVYDQAIKHHAHRKA